MKTENVGRTNQMPAVTISEGTTAYRSNRKPTGLRFSLEGKLRGEEAQEPVPTSKQNRLQLKQQSLYMNLQNLKGEVITFPVDTRAQITTTKTGDFE